MRLLNNDDEPRSGVSYILEIDGNLIRGKADEDGVIECSIPPNAREGRLTIEENQQQEEYQLKLGHLDPIDEISGVQSRLNNLGFYRSRTDAEGEMGSDTAAALRHFQRKRGLPVTGELDDDTRRELENSHGS
jgi:N-acetylmuramoyl-L-alanine amidase